jgi:putative ABC transport system permease protein
MNELLLLRVSLNSLLHHKGRALLTMLGIIIGVSAIIATLAIGRGAEKKIQAQISAMGENSLSIYSGDIFSVGKSVTSKRKKTQWLRQRDVLALEKQLPHIKQISPFMNSKNTVNYSNKYIRCDIKGGNESFLKITKRVIKIGTGLNANHIAKSSKVIVLGSKIRKTLFGHENPLGKKIKIDKTIFRVIGVVDEIKDFFGSHRDPNDDVYMPFSTMRHYVLKQRSKVIHGIEMNAHSEDDLPVLRRQSQRIMRARHKLEKSDPDDFTIFDQQSIAKAGKEASRIMQLFLLIIASISLIVGGVGVMNIMLVSVTERTKEIGIRMALGATRALVLRQFLYESLVLCFLGGTIGVAFGVAIPSIVSMFTDWRSEVSMISILTSFGVTTLVGLFFGYYPARKASMMNPVEALADR